MWSQDPIKRIKLLGLLVDSVQGLKGGALLSAVRAYSNHGDPAVKQFIEHLLVKVYIDRYMLSHYFC